MSKEEKIVKKEKLLILCLDAPYSTPLLADKLSFMKSASKLYQDVVVFFYIDGIHQLKEDQFARSVPEIGHLLRELNSKSNLRFVACSRCSGARGYLDLKKSDIDNNLFVPQNLIEGVEIASILDVGKYISHGYRITRL